MRAFGPLCQYIHDQTLGRVSKCVSSYSDRTTFLADAPVVSRLVLRATRIRTPFAHLFLRSFAPASGFPARKRDNGPSSLVSQSPGIAVIDNTVLRSHDYPRGHRPYNYQSTVPYVITVSICCSSFLSRRGWIFNFIGVRIPGA